VSAGSLDRFYHGACTLLRASGLGASRSVVLAPMPEQFERHSHDLEGERARRLRLRADGQRPLLVNLEETILLTRKLFELRDAARRAR
jgi:hypothetical protein